MRAAAKSAECPHLARLRHANSTERCPLSGVTRNTFAHAEFFSVLTQQRHLTTTQPETLRLPLAPSAMLVGAARMPFLGGGDKSEATTTSCVLQWSGGRIAFRKGPRAIAGHA